MNDRMSLGLGTAAIGRPQYINIRQETSEGFDLDRFRQHGLSVLEMAYQLGVRYFDTAPGYGLAEQLLLDWIGTKNDPTIVVATKWGYTYVADFDPKAIVHEVKEHSVTKLNEQWEVSKELLPFLQVYQVHSATLETGVLKNKEVKAQLASLKEKYGLKIGITTTGDQQVEVIKKAMEVEIGGQPLFEAFQVTYNVLDQSLLSISDDLIREGRSVIIKEALANGRLFRNDSYPRYNNVYDNIEGLASKYGVGVDAVALNFCKQTIPGSTVLSGAANKTHLEQNLKLNKFKLSSAEIAEFKELRTNEIDYWNERKQLDWN